MPQRRLSMRLICLASAVLATSALAADPAARTDVHGDPLPGKRALVWLGTVRLKHPGARLLRFSPDGKTLASASQLSVRGGTEKKSSVRLWETASGKELWSLTEIKDHVGDLAFSPDGKLLAVATDRGISFFDAVRGARLQQEAKQLYASHLVFSPDSKVLASSNATGGIFLRDIGTANKIALLDAHDELHFLGFMPDGKGLISTGVSHPSQREEKPRYTYCLWESTSGRKLAEVPLPAHLYKPIPWGFADGKTWTMRCYDALGDRYVLWQPATGKEQAVADGTVNSLLTTSLDGKTAAAQGDKGIEFWDIPTGQRLSALPAENKPLVTGMALSPDGSTLAYIGDDPCQSITLWHIPTRSQRPSFETHQAPITASAAAPNGQTIATGSADGAVRLWEAATGKALGHIDNRTGKVTHLAFMPDSRQLVVARQERKGQGTIEIWNLANGQLARRFGAPGDIYIVEPVADGKSVIVLTSFGLRRLDKASGRELDLKLYYRSDAWAVSRNGRCAVTLDRLGQMSLHDLDQAKTVWQIKPDLKQRERYGGLPSFSPDGLLVIVAGPSKIWLVDAVTGAELGQMANPFRRDARAMFSPDGRMLLLSQIGQQPCRLLDAITGKELWAIPEMTGPIPVTPRPMAFTADSKALIAADEMGTALVWDLDGLLPADQSEPPAKLVQALRTDLRSRDGLQAYAAFCRLRAQPRAALLAAIREEMNGKEDARRIDSLITDLDSDRFLVRQKAGEQLAALGPRAEAALRKVLEGQPSLELRKRVERLLAHLEPVSERQARWAIKLVELAGGRDSRELLQDLASGAADSALTKEAKAALERLSKSSEP